MVADCGGSVVTEPVEYPHGNVAFDVLDNSDGRDVPASSSGEEGGALEGAPKVLPRKR